MTLHPALLKHPEALTPSLRIPGANRPIRLYSGSITYVQPGERNVADSTIEFVWIPSPRILFRTATIPIAQAYAYQRCLDPVELHLSDGRVFDNAHMTLMSPATQSASQPTFRASLGGRILETPKPPSSMKASYVEFLVPQLKTTKGWPIRYGEGLNCARHMLAGGDWSITLDEVKNCDATWRKLERDSGCGVTHVGRLERLDKSAFDADATRHALRGLGWYLSFASGRWTGPILPRGFDANGTLLWDLWDAWRIVPYVERPTWIRPHMTEQFEEPFGGFFKAWETQNLTEVVEIAIHWYVEANAQAGSTEGSIVLTQAAFEMLASAMPVAKHAGIKHKVFDKLSAGMRSKHLFDWAGIPTALPVQFKDLSAVTKAIANADAPAAMAMIRNTITHPTPKNRVKFSKHTDQARYEAWLISLWYLELCILRVFDYQGRYRNRCTGKLESVPWAPKSNAIGGQKKPP
jgi:hypothetical protein